MSSRGVPSLSREDVAIPMGLLRFASNDNMKIPSYKFEKELWAQGCEIVAGVDEVGRGAWAGPLLAAAVVLPKNKQLKLLRDSKAINQKQREKLAQKIKKEALAYSYGIVEIAEINEQKNISKTNTSAIIRALENLTAQLSFHGCHPERAERVEGSRKPLQPEKVSLRRGECPCGNLICHPEGACEPTPSKQLRRLDRRISDKQDSSADIHRPQNDRKGFHVLLDGRSIKFFPFEYTAIVKGDAKSVSIAAASILAKVERDWIMSELGKEYHDYQFEKHKGYGTKLHQRLLEQFGPSAIHRLHYKPLNPKLF